MRPGWVSGEVEYAPLTMTHDRLSERPRFACPPSVRVRAYVDGDEVNWARIEAAAGAFPNEDAALAHFEREFAPHRERLRSRMLFIENGASGPIGTTTAWDGELAGQPRGRIHWVGIHPDYQGRGLSKPLLSAALDRLAVDSDRAFLTTETTSYRGINLYLGFGFVPSIESDEDRRGWGIVAEKLGKRLV
jgi:ribosomal protein S18 acetylase RimI-like enzyme